MKKTLLLGIFFAIAGVGVLPAQHEEPERQNAAERIMTESGGNVYIDIPEDILELLMTEQESGKKNPNQNLRPGINKLSGFRIQVFSDGRHQSTLESRAKARGNAIAARFPKYRGQVYTFSSAPNWYTRVGNFRSREDAQSALSELKRAFPAFAGEMRVVKSQIVVIK